MLRSRRYLRPVGTLHLFDVRNVVAVLCETSIGVVRLDFHSFLSSGGSWHQWFALYSNIIGIFRSDGVTDLVDDSVPDMVVPADILALTAGAMKEMHGICCEANPPIAPAQDTTLRVADVQGRRRSQ
jgi:hypothetical protein